MCRLYVDEVLIRIFQNFEDEGIPYLNSKAVQAYMSVFDGSSWATRGGRDKIDWTNSPFKTVYTHFVLDACVVEPTNISASQCANTTASKHLTSLNSLGSYNGDHSCCLNERVTVTELA